MRRDGAAAAETKPKDSTEEEFEKVIANLSEKLGPKEREELKKIMDGVHAAKTNDQHFDAYVRDDEFIYVLKYSMN